MTEKHFIITLTENITVSKTSGVITRNSNSTQWLDIALENWKLGEGEELYIELSHYDDDTELTTHVGPLHLLFNEALERYITLAPPELICVSGTWNYSIEQRFNIGENVNGEITYNSITSSINELSIVDTIVSAVPTNSLSKEAELLTAVRVLQESVQSATTAAKEALEAAIRAETAADRMLVYWGFNEAQKYSDLIWEVI